MLFEYISAFHPDKTINSPLTQILHLLLLYFLSLPALVFHDEFWVLVKHGILAAGEWREIGERIFGMDVSWCAAHEPISLLYHGSNI